MIFTDITLNPNINVQMRFVFACYIISDALHNCFHEIKKTMKQKIRIEFYIRKQYRKTEKPDRLIKILAPQKFVKYRRISHVRAHTYSDYFRCCFFCCVCVVVCAVVSFGLLHFYISFYSQFELKNTTRDTAVRRLHIIQYPIIFVQTMTETKNH